MARNYAALLHEYLEEMDILSDAEFGRLCRALLRYSMAGEEVRLEGAEKVMWKRVKNQEDRHQESYNELTESRRAAGKKGAAKRWQSMASDGKAMASDGKAMASDGKNAYTETKTETDTLLPNGRKGTRGPARCSHGQYGWVKLTSEEFDRLAQELGEEELRRCIAYVDESAQSSSNKNGWKDWNLVIRRCHRDGWGIKPTGKGRKPAASADPQPSDERIQKSTDWLDSFLAEQGGEA